MTLTQKRSILQYRTRIPKAGEMPYSPQRDFAYLFPALMNEVMHSLRRENWMDYYAGWLTELGVTEDELADAANRLAAATTQFIGNPNIKGPDDAYAAVGLFDVSSPARIMLFERLGESMAAGFFIALRDVTMEGEEPPQATDIAAYVGAARRLIVKGPIKVNPEEDKLAAEAELELCRTRMATNEKQMRDAQANFVALSRELERWQKLPWYKRLWLSLKGQIS